MVTRNRSKEIIAVVPVAKTRPQVKKKTIVNYYHSCFVAECVKFHEVFFFSQKNVYGNTVTGVNKKNR